MSKLLAVLSSSARSQSALPCSVNECSASNAQSSAKSSSPYVVGEKIRDIINSGTWQLRHPVGPDAAGLRGWRASMSDEKWVEWGAMSDEQWVAYVRHNFGLNVSL